MAHPPHRAGPGTNRQGRPSGAGTTSRARQETKKEKGAAVLTWLLQKSPTFAVERHSRSRDNTFEKRDRWLSQLEADRKWSEQEQQLLIASGRVLWREDPMTPGVYEYKDTQDFRGSSKVRDRSSWERVREEELPEEKGWEEALGKDLSTFLRSSTPLQKGLGKGAASSSTGDRFLGKGKCKPSAKAKAKGHNKGHLTIENLDPALAIEDRSSAELQAEALGKARKMRTCSSRRSPTSRRRLTRRRTRSGSPRTTSPKPRGSWLPCIRT